jgi:hypothetical protein
MPSWPASSRHPEREGPDDAPGLLGTVSDNTSFLSRASVEAVLRGSEVVVYTVTTGRGEDLVGIAEATGGAAFRRHGPGGMAKTFANAIANFRSRYLLSVTLDADSSPAGTTCR